MILTTTGRRSGKPRTVPLQYFPDGDDFIVVAANSGLPSPSGWYFNLMSNPTAQVEIGDRTLPVSAEELTAEQAALFWATRAECLDPPPGLCSEACRNSRSAL